MNGQIAMWLAILAEKRELGIVQAMIVPAWMAKAALIWKFAIPMYYVHTLIQANFWLLEVFLKALQLKKYPAK